MLYRLRRPAPPLRAHVEYLWYHEGFNNPWHMERLLPDGGMELIVDLTDSPKHWARGDLTEAAAVRRSWLSGQHAGAIAVESARNSRMIGVRFRPGGAAPFFGVPMSCLANAVVELDALWGGDAAGLRERLLEADGTERAFDLLEQALRCRAGGATAADRTIDGAVQFLTYAPDTITIRQLAARLGVSQKRLLGLFERNVGLKPKMLSRVLRLQRVLQRIEAAPHTPWSTLAAEHGYTDQAHLVKDFVALTGIRPREYMRDRIEWLNWVPIAEGDFLQDPRSGLALP